MEPTYNLLKIKSDFSSVKKLRLTRTARINALDELGMDDQDIVDAIASLTSNDFYKTMPSIKKPCAPYLDVYRFSWKNQRIYAKFQDLCGLIVVSFKAR